MVKFYLVTYFNSKIRAKTNLSELAQPIFQKIIPVMDAALEQAALTKARGILPYFSPFLPLKKDY